MINRNKVKSLSLGPSQQSVSLYKFQLFPFLNINKNELSKEICSVVLKIITT